MHKIVDRLAEARRPAFSIEFFPPRDAADEQRLWHAIRQLETMDPLFASVTYGAGGSSRERTIRTTGRVAQETTLVPMAHLTAVSHSVAELRHVIGWYAAVGVRNILAVRGDPPGDPMGEWIAHPEGLTYADELVRLCKELGDFCVGVSAFPYGHPRSDSLATDTEYLVRKIDAGADFAIAQLFFHPDDFLRLRERVAARGCTVPILPGVMPLTTPKTLRKAVELSGVPETPAVVRELEPYMDDPASFRAAGMDFVHKLSADLLGEGVDALHFYTMNRSTATGQLVDSLGLSPALV
ncbi:5,10-methylenetetrahydrofolate reductase (NAD(P)) [Tamaricihabitans halophyticus]|uniref:Methylenetetrahydrofolate reductase n=1 Tax=Tamaricihabitans halophyticus TaxID=1262583 RepID=A0A4R2QML6_9PSEU|nr:methylenetetrahydrofolate reductase [Tamaricihabitans halophyticus]TCP50800.1 5,10-methylenetetrahydrofolate reductase (NAD(P)) [Tamaricihabitans halophyticus]